MIVAEKMAGFGRRSSWIRKMFEEGARLKEIYGVDQVCDFSLGNPDLSPPPEFGQRLQSLAASGASGVHAYMANAGYRETREMVAKRIAAEQGVDPGADGVIMTCGAAGAINIALKAILNPGDEVIVVAPYFVEYGFYVDNHGGRAVPVAAGDGFDLDPDAVGAVITEKTRAIIVNSPNNPSGMVYPASTLKRLAAVLASAADRYGRPVFLINDEPYRRIVYDQVEIPAIMDLWPHTMVADSFSKELSIPGERIGYLAVSPAIAEHDDLVNAMILANRILGFVNAPAFMQRAIAALDDVCVDYSPYHRRRDLFSRILRDAGLAFTPPRGGFYFFPRSPIADEVEFCDILRDEKILAVPGRGFGTPGYFRLAFCVNDKVIERSAAGFKRAVERAGRS